MEALLVTNSDKNFSLLAEVVRLCGDYNIVRASCGAAARRAFSERDFDLVIIEQVKDERGKLVARALAETYFSAGVILLEDSFVYEQVASELEPLGIIVVPRPVHRTLLITAIRFMHANNVRIGKLKNQNNLLVKEIEDLKFINKAKYALMESLGYSENQAHKYIEKRAMDERKTKKAVALEVLKTYDV